MHRGRNIVPAEDSRNAILELPVFLRPGVRKIIAAAAGMGIKIQKWLLLAPDQRRQLQYHSVFENICVISCVKQVTISEHDRIRCAVRLLKTRIGEEAHTNLPSARLQIVSLHLKGAAGITSRITCC